MGRLVVRPDLGGGAVTSMREVVLRTVLHDGHVLSLVGNRVRRCVVVYPFVVVVNGDGQDFFSVILSDDVLVEVVEYLLGRRRWFFVQTLFVFGILLLFTVYFAEHNEEVVALLAFYETGRTDEGLDVRTGITAFRTG